MKYDFELDLTSNNSLALISKKIRKHATILEFGPAAGRLTRYLKEKLECDVYIVEIDQDAAERALQYAKDGIVGDIEEMKWLDKFGEIQFDYIIFADVLEHLYDPKRVLSASVNLLKDDGAILLSIPNIAHNSVIIDMMKSQFKYRSTGLLDDTHVRFFTYYTLLEMIDECNLMTVSEEAVIKKVGETEIGSYFDGLPNSVASYLKNRHLGDVYQYIFVMGKKGIHSGTAFFKNISAKSNYYYSQLYIDTGAGFSENQTIINTQQYNGVIEFDLKDYEQIKKLRFDPLNVSCSLRVDRVELHMSDGSVLKVEGYENNADYQFNGFLLFFHEDSQFIFEKPRGNSNIEKLILNVAMLDVEIDQYNYTTELLNNQANLIKDKEIVENQLLSAQGLISSLSNEKKEYINEIEQCKREIENLEAININLVDELGFLNEESKVRTDEHAKLTNTLSLQIEELKKEIEKQSLQLNQIHSSRSWKLISKIKKLGVR
ncbi:class I SAM-dependent methyltransferase [Paenibacillus sp. SEL3]